MLFCSNDTKTQALIQVFLEHRGRLTCPNMKRGRRSEPTVFEQAKNIILVFPSLRPNHRDSEILRSGAIL